MAAVSSAGQANHGKALVRARILSTGSTSHWKNYTGARPLNLLSHGTSSVPSVGERGGKKVLLDLAVLVTEGVFGSHSARWVP